MEQGLFFPSRNGDRRYKSSDFTQYFAQLFSNGVFSNQSDNLQVLASDTNGLSVVVKPGFGNINGYLYQLSEQKTLLFDISDVSGTAKKGAVVLRLDLNERQMTVEVKGTDSLTRTASVYELMLARISIPGGGKPITQSMIQDMRGNGNVCGYVSSLIDIDPTTLWLQFEADFADWKNEQNHLMSLTFAEFREWMEHVQTELSGDVAGNLQLQLDSMTPDKELASIQHDLDDYPAVKVITWSYNIGMVGLGEEPTGFAGSSGELVPVSVEYLDLDNLTIKVPRKYAMIQPDIKKLNTHQYILNEGVKTLIVTFK